MSQFTFYQVVRLKQVYQSHVNSLQNGLTVVGFGNALEELGYYVLGGATNAVVHDLLKTHSIKLNSRKLLDFDTFLDIVWQLEDRPRELNPKTMEALEYFEHAKADRFENDKDLTYADLEEILQAGPSDKYVDEKVVHSFICLVESYVKQHKSTVVDALRNLVLPCSLWKVAPQRSPSLTSSLHYTIRITVLHANNLRRFARPKPSSDGKYELRLDPFLSVGIPGISPQLYSTPVALDECEPEWMQDISIPIVLPSSNAADVLQWISQQVLVFGFYDHQSYGVVPTSECLATATISLPTLVFHAISSMFTCHHLEMQPCQTPQPERNSQHPPPCCDVLVDIPKELTDLWHGHGQSCIPAANAWPSEILTCLKETAVHDTHLFQLVGGDVAPHLAHQNHPGATMQDLEANSTSCDQLVYNHAIPSDELFSYMKENSTEDGFNVIASLIPACSLQNQEESKDELGWRNSCSSIVSQETQTVPKGKDYILQTVVQNWERVRREVQQRFPRRIMHFVAMDEYEFFRFLPCFVSPMRQCVTQDMDCLARIVSRLDTSQSLVQPTPQTCDQVIHNPSFIISAQQATVLEAHILLCGLFLGIGQDAYVLLGSCGGKPDEPRVLTLSEENEPTIWFACSGTKVVGLDSFTTQTVDCVFSHQNAWANYASSNRLNKAQFTFNDTTLWYPLATSNTCFGGSLYFPRVYSTPKESMLCAAASVEGDECSEFLESDIREAITMYRHHVLFIHDTTFNDMISNELSALLEQNFTDSTIRMDSSGPVAGCYQIPNSIHMKLPFDYYWFGKWHTFFTTDVSVIMRGLQASGLLDCSVPHTMYTLAVRSRIGEFGFVQTIVYVGYMFKLTQ